MVILWILIGVVGGVLGGMGMGGGTLLIPLLTGLGGLEQHVAQAVNLIAFAPMSAIALWIHFRHGLVKTKGLLPMILSACVFGAIFAAIAQVVDADFLKRSFGVFLAVLGVCLLIGEIVKKKRSEAV